MNQMQRNMFGGEDDLSPRPKGRPRLDGLPAGSPEARDADARRGPNAATLRALGD